jgi:hypothetical protein
VFRVADSQRALAEQILKTGYAVLLLSFHRSFELRGESLSSARFAAACAMTVFVAMNVLTVILLLEIFDQIAPRSWPKSRLLIVCGLAGLGAANWYYLGRLLTRGPARPGPEVADAGGNSLWIWYSAISAVALVICGAISAVR